MVKFEKERIVFAYGISVRSGTNFFARLISKNENAEVIPANETTREFPFMKKLDEFEFAFKSFKTLHVRNNGGKEEYTWEKFKPFLGEAFLSYIEKNLINDYEKELYLIKEPGLKNLEHFFELFPKNKLVIIFRDGRDMLASADKAYLANQGKRTLFNRLKRYFKHYTGMEFRANTKSWVNNVDIALTLLGNKALTNRILSIKYEDLVHVDSDTLSSLESFLGIKIDNDQLDKVEVMGSSFTEDISNLKNKISWQPIERTESFNPIGRWKSWPRWKIKYFEKHAREYMDRLGYH